MKHPRVGIFSLWTAEPRSGRLVIASQVFVHSKVLIVDDKWAMVGSANLDGVSLDSYGDDFAGPVARRLFRNVRNFDVDAIVTWSRSAAIRSSGATRSSPRAPRWSARRPAA